MRQLVFNKLLIFLSILLKCEKKKISTQKVVLIKYELNSYIGIHALLSQGQCIYPD